MVKTSTYKLWCQDLAFLECYTAFMTIFLVDISELTRWLPNFENDFTGQPTKMTLKIGFADALLVQQPKDHKPGCEVNCTNTMWDNHSKEQPWILLDHSQCRKGAIAISLWWLIISANGAKHIPYQPQMPLKQPKFCRKLDLALRCSTGAAHRPRKELRIEPVCGDVQTVED